MSTSEQLSEDEIMTLRGIKAAEAFTLYVSLQIGKRVHLMSSSRYITIRQGPNFITNSRGDLYPEGIERFIENESRDPDCAGLVPLTEEADKILQTKGLRDFPFGPNPNFGIEDTYKIYRK